MTKNPSKKTLLSDISRRDFVNGTLVGAGAALLGCPAPAFAKKQIEEAAAAGHHPWDGFSGVGDYARSNGNITRTHEAAHLIRDGMSEELLESAIDTGEEYDMVIIGGGFSGIGAAYQFHKDYPDKKCLILENHPIFGGEAKQNEFEVDGYRLYAPQGSNDFGVPNLEADNLITDIYRTCDLPTEFAYKKPDNSGVRAPRENYYGVFWDEERYDTGYFMGKNADPKWVVNPRMDNLERMPWSEDFKRDLNATFEDAWTHNKGEGLDQWLDTMTYKELLEDVMGMGPEVASYYDPIIAISMGGVGCDVYSAYSAKLLEMPGCEIHYKVDMNVEITAHSYPGGNTAIIRHIVKHLIPDSISGGNNTNDISYAPISFEALDRPDNPVSIRLDATAIDFMHEGDPETADHLMVSYVENGEVKQVKAKTVVPSIGGWVARTIARDIPDHIYDAYTEFHHSPILVANVAVRNWQFLDKLGISQGRWFEGFGNFFSIREPMEMGEKTQPFDPDKPVVLTFYVPFVYPGEDRTVQGSIGREEMLSKSYAEYEAEIVGQMTDMFEDYGFEAERDIAGIIINRWGHAYISPQPGYHFDRDGKKSPINIVKEGYGRVQFGHSELGGYMSHTIAINQGARAVRALKEKLV